MASIARDLAAEMLKKFPHGFKGGIGGAVTGSIMPFASQWGGIVGAASNEFIMQMNREPPPIRKD